MPRAFLPSLACLFTALMSSPTMAGPFLLDGSTPERAQPSGIATATQPPALVRRTAGPANLGGGFLEFLVGGERRQDAASAYRSYPADLGPGVVESPSQPGQLVVDPRIPATGGPIRYVRATGHRLSSIRMSDCSISCRARNGHCDTASVWGGPVLPGRRSSRV